MLRCHYYHPPPRVHLAAVLGLCLLHAAGGRGTALAVDAPAPPQRLTPSLLSAQKEEAVAVIRKDDAGIPHLVFLHKADSAIASPPLPEDAIQVVSVPTAILIFCRDGSVLSFDRTGRATGQFAVPGMTGVLALLRIDDEGLIAVHGLRFEGKTAKPVLLLGRLGAELIEVHQLHELGYAGVLTRNGNRVWVVGRSTAQYVELGEKEIHTLKDK